VTVCLCVSLLAGCGGTSNPTGNPADMSEISNSGSSSSGSGSPHTVLPAKSRILLGATQQFTSDASDVTWAVNVVPGGNDMVGTISSTGLYTAPVVVPFSPVITIKATSKAGGSSASTLADIGALTGTRFAYVSSATDNSIQIFTADGKTGMLQPTSTLSGGAGTAPTALALSPNGNFLFSLNRGSNDISIYAIDPGTGNLANAGTVLVPNGPYAMVFSSKGDFAYVSCDGASTVAAFAFSLGTGALTPLSSGSYVAGGGRIQSLAMSPDGKFLYAVNRDANEIIGLAIAADGSLSPITGSPFSAQPGLSSIVISKGNYAGDAQYLYAGFDNGIEAYSRDGSGVLFPQAIRTEAGKSPELFRNVSDGLLVGVNPQNGGGFSYAFDYLGFPPGALAAGGPPVSTGTSPVAGGWLWSDGGDANWVYVLNRQADPSSTTGSIGVYQADYTHGLVGPSATIPTELHNPTGFVVTP
jgi:6-phosphogluconolactonase (cycloisomerase 2 family)